MLDRDRRKPIIALNRFLTEQVSRPFDFRTVFWLCVSLFFSIAFASRALQQAFSSQYVLQDDARQHIFWMARFVDPELYPLDVIADYFQAVAPEGYTLLYRIMAGIGVDPFLLAKLLPMGLGLLTTVFCFAVLMQIVPVPAGAFIGTLLLNQSLWMRNGLVSATPRAFISPLFLAFMYFWLRRSPALMVVCIALMGLFFPSTMFIALGVLLLGVLRWKQWRPRLSREKPDYYLCAAGLAVAVIVLLPYAFKTSGFGPVFTAAEAATLPEFLPGGRIVVFRQNFLSYWLTGSHTGMFSSAVFSPLTLSMGLLLPILLLFPKRFPLVKQLSQGNALMRRVIAASVVMFFAANVLLFHLYLPSRFTVNIFRILLAVAAGLSVIVILDAVFRSSVRSGNSVVAFASAGVVAGLLVLPFAAGAVVDTRYKTGDEPRLYEYLGSQPKDTLTASLANEADNLPMFTRRSILVGRETALPYHKRYYHLMRERAVDLINAQYSASAEELQRFIKKHAVNYLLVDRDAFTPDYLAKDKVILQYQPAANEAIARLQQGVVPALSQLIAECSVLETKGLVLISSECVLARKPGVTADSSPAFRAR